MTKEWSFSFNISPSNEHPGLIFFRMDWLEHLAVQGTLKSLLQHHSSKASILWCSAFFIFVSFIFISWKLITLQYCSGFYHTLTSISHVNGEHVLLIPIPTPASLPIPSLWVFPVHQLLFSPNMRAVFSPCL